MVQTWNMCNEQQGIQTLRPQGSRIAAGQSGEKRECFANDAALIVQRDTVCACLFVRRAYRVRLCSPPRAEARFLGSRAQESRGEDHNNMRARGDGMQSVVGIAFLVVGVVLIIFGMNASALLGSRLSEFFTGAPSDRTIWLLVAGVAAVIIGLGMLLVGRRRTL